MRGITQFSIRNARLTVVFLAAVVVSGLATFATIPSQEDPEITIRSAQVTAHFPGLSVGLMEDLIARPLEKKIKEIPELDEQRTTISTGVALIEVRIGERYFDMAPIWQSLRNKMEDMKDQLPSGTQGPFVNDDFGRVAAATIALHGRGFELRELRDVARHLQDRLGTVNGVSRVQLYGVQPERVYLDFNATRLIFYDIPPDEIVNALKRQNVVLPGGSIVADNLRIVIEPSGNFESLEDIRNLQIAVPETGQTVYLRDIVNIRRDYAEPPMTPAFFNARPALIMGVSMVPQYNIEDFGEDLSAAVEALRLTLPVGLQMDFATYQPALVKTAVDSAVNNLYQTVAVVLTIVVLFLGLRTGLIVGAIVPLTILMSLVVMNFWGIDLQRMSIAAIIISLGLLVDNGIVIAEDMRRRIDAGAAKRDAAQAAAGSLGVPLLTSSLTTIFAFTPLILSENATSEYLGSLAQVIIIALLSSWFLALYATPALCTWFLKDTSPGATSKESAYLGKVQDAYRRLLARVLARKALFTGGMAGLLSLSVLGLSLVPPQMMPYSDRGQLLVYLDLPAGSDIHHTIRVTRKLAAWLSDAERNPQIESNVAYIGFGGPRFFLALSPPDPADNAAFLVVNLKNKGDVPATQARINAFVLDELPEANGRVKRMFLGAKEIGLVEYRIKGADAGKLYAFAHDLEKALRDIAGTVAVRSDWQNPVPRIRVEIDQQRARRAGVTSESVARSLSAYYDGYAVTDYREGDRVLPVTLLGDQGYNRLGELITLPMLSQSGAPVPLVQIADFSSSVEPNRLIRVDQERTITVSAKHIRMQAAELNERMLPALEALDLPEGYRVEVGGEVESASQSNGALFSKMPFALVGIALLLIWQFNSLRRPLIILLTIPLVLIGATAGLIISGAFLSFTAILGLFSLAGIIVNNGIVLIDRIDSGRAEGLPVHDAVITACMARMRPILMTTLTTMVGLVPILLFGGALWYPMAVVIIFGLAVGTVLTLAFVPTLYVLFFGGRA